MSLVLWQVLDSAFPAGGYTRSGGLEAAVAIEGVPDPEALNGYLEQALAQAAGCGLPLVNAAWDQPEDLPRWNELAKASLPNPVALGASRAQGRALLEAAARIFGPAPVADLIAAEAQHAPACGVLLKRLGCSREDARRALLYWALRDAVSAAVRLGLIGSYAAQRLQYEQHAVLEDWVRQSEDWGADALAQQAPLMDLWQAGHARLQRRLFQS